MCHPLENWDTVCLEPLPFRIELHSLRISQMILNTTMRSDNHGHESFKIAPATYQVDY